MTEFFINHWPGQPMPVPPVRVAHFRKPESADAQVIGVDFRRPAEEVRVPDELYLRELVHLDLSDARAIWKFCEEFGSLVTRSSEYLGPRYDPGHDPDYIAISGTWGFVREAQALRNCVRIWDALQGDLSLDEVRRRWEGPLGLLVLDSDELALEEEPLAEMLVESRGPGSPPRGAGLLVPGDDAQSRPAGIPGPPQRGARR